MKIPNVVTNKSKIIVFPFIIFINTREIEGDDDTASQL